MDKKTSGFTLIEMLVGIVIGMIVVAAASVMMVTVLKSQKDITASARLNQELGAALAVMSNEIRRAGFRVCDIDDAAFECPKIDTDGDGVDEEVPFIFYNTSSSDRDLEVFDVDGNGEGDCILYRYNANVDNADDPQELRGFRIKNNIIEMSDTTGNVACGNDANWVPLTDPNVIDITGLSFSTTGSKCRNMTLPDPNPSPAVIAQYWVVISDSEIVMGCDDNGDAVEYCLVTEDPTDPLKNITDCSGVSKVFTNGDKLFGTRQIRIVLEASLARDQAVTKRLESSVKVVNPAIEIVPEP